MNDACREARSAGLSRNRTLIFIDCFFIFLIKGGAIKRITCVDYDSFGKPICVTDRQSMVQAARGLLSAVTRVLLLADMVVVKQIITVKKKVCVKSMIIKRSSFNFDVDLGRFYFESFGIS